MDFLAVQETVACFLAVDFRDSLEVVRGRTVTEIFWMLSRNLSSGSCDSECNFTRSYRDNLSPETLTILELEDFRVILPSVSAVKMLVFLVL